MVSILAKVPLHLRPFVTPFGLAIQTVNAQPLALASSLVPTLSLDVPRYNRLWLASARRLDIEPWPGSLSH